MKLESSKAYERKKETRMRNVRKDGQCRGRKCSEDEESLEEEDKYWEKSEVRKLRKKVESKVKWECREEIGAGM